jgi:hypothetical protein
VTGKVGATGTAEVEFTLGTDWQTIEIPLTGVTYNTANPAGGVNTGLFLYLHREAADTAVRTIYIDDIEWTAAEDDGGEGGAAGAAGAGGAGGNQ